MSGCAEKLGPSCIILIREGDDNVATALNTTKSSASSSASEIEARKGDPLSRVMSALRMNRARYWELNGHKLAR